jgi:micrococcal nuclease
MYYYNSRVEKVIDGDTVRLDIDLGFTVHWKSNCRLYGINTPELNSKDPEQKIKALEAKQFLIDNLPKEVVIHSRELDKYGRPLVDIYVEGRLINDEIIEKGFSQNYMK